MRALLIGACACFLLTHSGVSFAQGRPAGVMTDLVSTEMMSETVSVFGEVVAGRESAVAARVTGTATEVPLRVGDRVNEGDLLARLDPERLEIELEQARAQLRIAEAGIVVATARRDRTERAFRRAETLAANATIADATVEDRQGEFAEAVGSVEEAEARRLAAETALRRAQYNYDNLTVQAPFTGVVLEIAAQTGQFVSEGSTVATLVDLGALEIEANVPARFVDALRPDLPVRGRTDAGGELTLSLRAILPTEFSATRTRPVRLEIVEGATNAAVGQAVTLDIPVSAPREAVVVPKDALVQGAGGGWTVFLNAEGTAQPRGVEIGAAAGDSFEVISGLQPGDEVVVRGNERLRPGQAIAPTRVDAPPAQATGQDQG